jgi:hypothetical protein
MAATDETQYLDELTRINNELVNLQRRLAKKNQELEEALARIRQLSGILPICMHCKQIRDDEGYWNRLEEFIQNHSDAEFTHAVCPSCIEKYYPDGD